MPSDLVFRRGHDRRLIRLIWPVSALLILALTLIAFPVVRGAFDANDTALTREKETLHALLRDRAAEVRMAAVALAVAARDKGVRLADAPLTLNELSLGRASGFILLEHGGRVMTQRLLDPPGTSSDPDIGTRLRAAASADPAGLAAGRLLVVGNSVTVAASADAPGGGVLVAYRSMTPASLAGFGRRFGYDGLALAVAKPEGAGAIPVPSIEAGETPVLLVWRPNRPGDALHGRLAVPLALGLILAALLFGTFVVAIRALAIDLATSHARAENLVGRDPLSGLPNRQLFANRLDQELSRTARTGEGLAVLFLDLDRFKDVNDTFGHQAGDALLIEVAKRLGVVLRGEDTLARFGGDEFAVIQTRLGAVTDAEALSRRILESLTQPFVLGGTSVTVGVSIGVALAPADGLERETLMRLADTALYQAKSGGRNRFCFFAREMDETIRLRKLVEDDLRHAIATDELVLHYQPIVSADGARILAVEALVRWPHPEHGLISPAKFVPVAEERGLVIPLGEWVLRRACRDAVRWPGVRLAVNVSALQFHHRDFVKSVMRATGEAGFDPRDLEIELTEGVLVDDEDAAEAAMMELRARGVNLALDDFGTGYSSLIYLRRFAFDKIKIDRSFLHSLDATGESAILVHSIVHLGRALGLTVTAEGVETREQHRFLQALGCHQLQGFLFSRPVPADEIDALIADGIARRAA